MFKSYLIIFPLWIGYSLCYGLNLDNTLSPDGVRPCSSSASSDPKCIQTFTYNTELDPLLGGSTTMNYFLTKNGSTEKASIVADYARNGINGKIIGSYKNDLTNPLASTSDARFNLAYTTHLSDSFTTVVSENLFVSEKESIPLIYTSSLETQYRLNDEYHLFTQGSYSYLQERQDSSLPLINPYTTSIGIGHSENSHTSVKALYTQSKEQNPALKPHKSINLIAKRRIGKKINTTLSVKKHIEPSLQEDKGSLSVHYTF